MGGPAPSCPRLVCRKLLATLLADRFNHSHEALPAPPAPEFLGDVVQDPVCPSEVLLISAQRLKLWPPVVSPNLNPGAKLALTSKCINMMSRGWYLKSGKAGTSHALLLTGFGQDNLRLHSTLYKIGKDG